MAAEMNDSIETLNDSLLGNKTEDDYIPYTSRPETYIVPAIFLLIFVVGVLGNGTLIVIFIRHKNMRNVPNTYIFSLALADLLVIITSVPFTSVIYAVDSWPWNETICKISETAKDISIGVSVFTLTALSGNRFFAIVDPMKKYNTTASSRGATQVTVCIVICIWILAITCAIPAAIGSHLLHIHDEMGTYRLTVCYPFPANWGHIYAQCNVIFKFLFLYVIPLIIIAIFYLLMANHLIVSTKNVPGEVQGTLRQIRARKRVAMAVLLFVFVFAVCLLPSHIFMLFFYFNPEAEDKFNAFWNFLRILGFCLCYSNSCVNPVALYWVSGTFRKYFNRYLLCSHKDQQRFDTYPGQQRTTTLSLVSSNRRIQSSRCTKRHASSFYQQDQGAIQDTTIVLLGNIKDQSCSKM